MNFRTFSEVLFNFRLTPPLIVGGLCRSWDSWGASSGLASGQAEDHYSASAGLIQPAVTTMHPAFSAGLVHDPAPGDVGIVLEDAEPLFPNGIRKEAPLVLEELDGIEVVRHEPWQRHVGRRGERVREVEGRASVRVDPDRLHPRVVAWHRNDADAGADLPLSIDGFEAPASAHGSQFSGW